MSSLKKYEVVIQQARADYLVDTIRRMLPPSSLWHEKIAGNSQIENLAITNANGSLSILTFDTTSSSYQPNSSICEFGDLGLLVQNCPLTPTLLNDDEIAHLLAVANAKFDKLAHCIPSDVVKHYRRLTCLMEFRSLDNNVNVHGERLFAKVAGLLELPLSYEPFDFAKANGYEGGTEWLEGAARTADFILDQPLDEHALLHRLNRLNLRDRQVNFRRVWATVPQFPEIHGLNIVARWF